MAHSAVGPAFLASRSSTGPVACCDRSINSAAPSDRPWLQRARRSIILDAIFKPMFISLDSIRLGRRPAFLDAPLRCQAFGVYCFRPLPPPSVEWGHEESSRRFPQLLRRYRRRYLVEIIHRLALKKKPLLTLSFDRRAVS